MGKTSALKPGQPTPVSGQYKKIGPRGGQGNEITAVNNKPLTPSDTPGSTYTLVDGTKNKSGKA